MATRECLMICCDNSASMINGDYLPTRLQAQREAINIIVSTKSQNPEACFGVLTMAGNRIELIVSPSQELADVLLCLQQVKSEGTCNFVAGLKTASLALKNRANKTLIPRIIMFAGSEILHTPQELIKVGKQFKKNAIAVDIISFGDEDTISKNAPKIEALHASVNNQDNSRVINIPLKIPGSLSDYIVSTLFAGDARGNSGSGSIQIPQPTTNEFGIDPNIDPELAMALRASMDEARLNSMNDFPIMTPQSQVIKSTPQNQKSSLSSETAMVDDEDEAALLAQAIAMSIAADEEGDLKMKDIPVKKAKTEKKQKKNDETNQIDSNRTDMQDVDVLEAMNDPNFVNELVKTLPGVGKNENLEKEKKEKNTRSKTKQNQKKNNGEKK